MHSEASAAPSFKPHTGNYCFLLEQMFLLHLPPLPHPSLRRRLSCFQACSEEPWVGSNKSCLAVAVAERASHFSPAEKKQKTREKVGVFDLHENTEVQLWCCSRDVREGCEGHRANRAGKDCCRAEKTRKKLKKNCPFSEKPQLAKQALDNRVPALRIYLGIACLFLILRWSNVAEAMKGGCISERRKIFNLHQ